MPISTNTTECITVLVSDVAGVVLVVVKFKCHHNFKVLQPTCSTCSKHKHHTEEQRRILKDTRRTTNGTHTHNIHINHTAIMSCTRQPCTWHSLVNPRSWRWLIDFRLSSFSGLAFSGITKTHTHTHNTCTERSIRRRKCCWWLCRARPYVGRGQLKMRRQEVKKNACSVLCAEERESERRSRREGAWGCFLQTQPDLEGASENERQAAFKGSMHLMIDDDQCWWWWW